jgi:hypothetical protein
MSSPFDAFAGVQMPEMNHFWNWAQKVFTPSYQNEVEHYLNESVDHKDLETRMRYLMRRGML